MSGNAETRTIDGLAVTLYGPAGGTPVLMSAGLGGHGAYWKPQAAALAARKFRVILYDHRGTGASERAPLPSPYTSRNLALDIARILDGLELDSAHIAGHAAGGVAGLELALRQPEKVASLTVVNGWAVADRHFKRCFEIRTEIYQAGGPLAYLKAQPLFLFPAAWISDHLDELDEQAAHHAENFQDEATLKARIGALAGFDISADLGRIRCPVLVIGTEDDMLVPARCSKILADGLPAATLVSMKRGGHAVNITEAPAFDSHLIGFLEKAGR
jgi:aminoacrylate hydrolase